jgi:hypothetical protein
MTVAREFDSGIVTFQRYTQNRYLMRVGIDNLGGCA